MPHFPPTSPTLMINQDSSFFLETNNEGLSLYSNSNKEILFQLKEPIILAQGIAEDPNQIHLAYLKKTGELCYSIISRTGEHQNTTLGKLDTRNNRYDRLILLPVDKVIHIFYATSHLALPDVWRITHLLWNGQTWKSAQLGEVVHPRHPLYHILLDSKSNLHLLMMTFLGNRSVLLSNFFNGSYHIWAKRQESLSIPREVVDMAALITPSNTGYLFWGAKQPGTDKFEVGFATQSNMCDFMSAWRIEPNPVNDISGPWKSFGAFDSDGVLNLLLNTDQERLFQFIQKRWNFISNSSSNHSTLHLIQKTESVINYTEWLLNQDELFTPLFSSEIQLSFNLPENLTLEAPAIEVPAIEASNSVPVFKTSVVTLPQPSITPESPPTSSQHPNTPVPEEQENEKVYVSLLKSLDEKISEISESHKALIEEQVAPLPKAIEALTLSVQGVSEAIASFTQQSLETQQALHSLEEKVNNLIAAQQPIRKKGFWERWLASMKK
ncbi:hypothetical protein [Desulfitobacterium metallireducens]|uniref:Uncharacterized protein n=1 Tax=Desulfitobacterium metallireducens DSM 15288 TaxID=871968 RepID=W0EAE7_9FIRM|nr:hypothetical protein [Desulfitobacterium metallireducens]AHF06041.1 hypothetical protein DESME_02425 [Desulfitobacterium metallireducens DSM 15288]